MYRSKNGLQQFKDIATSTLSAKGTNSLSKMQLKALSESKALLPHEKKDILLMSLGYKLSIEIEILSLQQNRVTDKKDIEVLLKILPFPYYLDSFSAKRNNKRVQIEWFQVSLNEKVNYFMKNYAENLSVMELGIIYGYPMEGIRAFYGLIDIYDGNNNTPNSASPNRKFSKDFYAREIRYEKKILLQLRKEFPDLMKQIESF
jgi:hypothetical protein